MTRWGKAGERLSPEDIARRDNANAAARGRSLAIRQTNMEKARLLWLHGMVRPYRITMFLDANDLYGPEVDAACGVDEPTVDLWEAGKVYPTWDELQALARLCMVQPITFCSDAPAIRAIETSLRYHLRASELAGLAKRIDEYPRAVVDAVVGAL
jgi:hypothetical protein